MGGVGKICTCQIPLTKSLLGPLKDTAIFPNFTRMFIIVKWLLRLLDMNDSPSNLDGREAFVRAHGVVVRVGGGVHDAIVLLLLESTEAIVFDGWGKGLIKSHE